jgi:iron uptake system component EfeO
MKSMLASVLLVAACGGGTTNYQQDVVSNMHDSIDADLANLLTAAKALQAAAPGDHAWDVSGADAAAMAAMKTAWRNTRIAYEHVEGATAPIFPDKDVTMDARYDDFLTMLGPTGDPDPFDDQGITGMHAIERILWSDMIPDKVVEFESSLPGYSVAAFPATADQANEFRTKLCQKLIDDAQQLHDEWTPSAIDIGAAYQGLVGLMNEQKEKVNLAATGEEESRYAQTTLFDLRNNLDGTTKIYDFFQPWIDSKEAGPTADTMIQSGFTDLTTLYAADPGDALPAVPDDWSSDMPTQADLATPFGMLWESVHEAVDPTTDGSVVFEMNQVAVMLGFPQFVED